jgi:hypothetical protein
MKVEVSDKAVHRWATVEAAVGAAEKGVGGNLKATAMLKNTLAKAIASIEAQAIGVDQVFDVLQWKQWIGEGPLSIWGCPANAELAKESARKKLKEASGAARKAAEDGFALWADKALLGGAKAAHRFTNTDGQLPPARTTIRIGGKTLTQPLEVMDQRVLEWCKKWKLKPERLELVKQAVEESKQRALAEQEVEGVARVTPQALDAALKGFSKDTSRSLRGWSLPKSSR